MNSAMQLKAVVKTYATRNHIPAQAVLQIYMQERLLERISSSRYKNRLILKGGMLIASLVGMHSRTTMDVDATVRGFPLVEKAIQSLFLEICAIPCDDPIGFQLEHIAPIRDDDPYGGFRVALTAHFENIRVPLKIDLTTGDVITPDAVAYVYPCLFEDRRIAVLAYPIETVLAEKVETILRRGIWNTRLRDYYDVYILQQTKASAINRALFKTALMATCANRASTAILAEKFQIIETLKSDAPLRARWGQYAREYPYAHDIAFDTLIQALTDLVS